MGSLPASPAPSSITLEPYIPTTKSRSINGMGTQTRSSGTFLWRAKVNYDLLEFSERDSLMAFYLEQNGRASEFDVIIPTHSENSGVSNITATSTANYAIGESTISLDGMTGELAKMNLIRINGQKATYAVVTYGNNIAGTQQVTIRPKLRTALTAGQSVITKNTPLNMSFDEDSLPTPSKGMTSSISFNLVEEVL